MKDNKALKNVLIFVVILLIFTAIYIVINKLTNKDNIDYEDFLKNYEVNEYITTYVSDEDMARIYLNTYIHEMYTNPKKGYELLDIEYREKKFKNITEYENYVNSLPYITHKMEKFYVDSKDGFKIYGVYDTNGNIYIFKTKGVMQYTVYLDDYTVEI